MSSFSSSLYDKIQKGLTEVVDRIYDSSQSCFDLVNCQKADLPLNGDEDRKLDIELKDEHQVLSKDQNSNPAKSKKKSSTSKNKKKPGKPAKRH